MKIIGTAVAVLIAAFALMPSGVAQAVPPTPSECAGMTFDQVVELSDNPDTLIAGVWGRRYLVFAKGGNDTIFLSMAGPSCIVGGDGRDIIMAGPFPGDVCIPGSVGEFVSGCETVILPPPEP